MKKRIEPMDLLTQEDKEAYQDYISIALECRTPDADSALSMWNKNKRTLFRALGKQLRVTIPIEIKKDDKIVERELRDVYVLPAYRVMSPDSYNSYYNSLTSYEQESFVCSFIEWCYYSYTVGQIDHIEFRQIANLLCHNYIMTGRVRCDFTIKSKKLKINEGAKIIKTIGKLVKALHYPDPEKFEYWRNRISDITTKKVIKSNLVISIHPLDFLSLSDNNCSWDSCYRLLGNGMHKEATISHMNSNIAAVAYLESSKDFMVGGHKIPNKSWRQLVYIHKDIICGGRSYPYYDENLSKKIIDIVQEMVYNSLKWKYQYKNQQYCDLWGLHSNEEILNPYWHKEDNPHVHKIKFYHEPHAGYNDFAEHQDEDFFCSRNWIPKSKNICFTGPLTCPKCGERVQANGYSTNILCDDCWSGKK